MIALVFIGQTGSGKTTIGRAVAQELELTFISSGDIARAMAKTDSYANAELELGAYAPELAMRHEVLARIEAATVHSGDFVLEGFPRTVEQLFVLESVPEVQPLYFVLDVDDLTCLRRLVARKRTKTDHPDAVGTRIKNYRQDTVPLIDMLWSHSFNLNGSLPVGTLTQEVIDHYRTAVNETNLDKDRS